MSAYSGSPPPQPPQKPPQASEKQSPTPSPPSAPAPAPAQDSNGLNSTHDPICPQPSTNQPQPPLPYWPPASNFITDIYAYMKAQHAQHDSAAPSSPSCGDPPQMDAPNNLSGPLPVPPEYEPTVWPSSPSPPSPPSPRTPPLTKAYFLANCVAPATENDRYNDNKCAFCWGSYDEAHPAVKIEPCEHVFGAACLEQIVEDEHRCPKCKVQLFERELPIR